jgi:hypothetical protein
MLTILEISQVPAFSASLTLLGFVRRTTNPSNLANPQLGPT